MVGLPGPEACCGIIARLALIGQPIDAIARTQAADLVWLDGVLQRTQGG